MKAKFILLKEMEYAMSTHKLFSAYFHMLSSINYKLFLEANLESLWK